MLDSPRQMASEKSRCANAQRSSAESARLRGKTTSDSDIRLVCKQALAKVGAGWSVCLESAVSKSGSSRSLEMPTNKSPTRSIGIGLVMIELLLAKTLFPYKGVYIVKDFDYNVTPSLIYL
jgi:hypothetical protein